MNTYKISLSEKEVNEILTNLNTVDSLVSKNAINLTKLERSSLPTIGKVRSTIVEKVLNASEEHPGIFPVSFSLSNFKNDWVTTQQFDRFISKLDFIYEKVYETRQALSAQAYNQASSSRSYIETANKANVPGLDTVVDELKKLFSRETEDDDTTIPAVETAEAAS